MREHLGKMTDSYVLYADTHAVLMEQNADGNVYEQLCIMTKQRDLLERQLEEQLRSDIAEGAYVENLAERLLSSYSQTDALQSQIDDLQEQLHASSEKLAAHDMMASRISYRILQRFWQITARFSPAGSRQNAIVRRLGRSLKSIR